MSFLLFAGIILFGFFIFLFVWMFRKDERYLNQMADQIQANKAGLRDLQEEIQSLQYKIDFINRICNSMKKEFLDLGPNKGREEAYYKVNQRISTDLTRLQEEVTNLKALLKNENGEEILQELGFKE